MEMPSGSAKNGIVETYARRQGLYVVGDVAAADPVVPAPTMIYSMMTFGELGSSRSLVFLDSSGLLFGFL